MKTITKTKAAIRMEKTVFVFVFIENREGTLLQFA